jgi:ribosomal protein S6
MEKDMQEKGGDMKIYELSYILLPSLAESEIPAKVSFLKDMITSAGGELISHEDPVLIDLSYSMTKVTPTSRTKVNTGHFGWIKFELSAGECEKIKQKLEEEAVIVRYLLIKTVRENTLLNGKMKFQKEEKEKKGEVSEEDSLVESGASAEKETSPEDIDKSIDDLVIA